MEQKTTTVFTKEFFNKLEVIRKQLRNLQNEYIQIPVSQLCEKDYAINDLLYNVYSQFFTLNLLQYV